jgi:hypothetical protein
MAKRARGANRPGQRAPLRRSGSPRQQLAGPAPANPAPTTTPRPTTLTQEEEARAAEIEARLVAAERSAEEAARRQARSRRTPDAAPATPRAGASLAVRTADEYAYVGRDVRRIAVIGGSMIAILIGIWVIVQATGIGPFTG